MTERLRVLLDRLQTPTYRLVMPEKVDRTRRIVREARPVEEDLLAWVRSTHVLDPTPLDPAFVIEAPCELPIPPRKET